MITIVVTMVLRRFTLRLTLLLLPWLVILAVPQFRRQLRGTANGNHLSFKPTPWIGLLNPAGRNSWPIGQPTTLEQKASGIRYGVGLDGVSIIGTPRDKDREYWKIFEYGHLSDCHPREAWLVAMALKNISSTQDGRVEYEWAASPEARLWVKQVNNFKPEMVREGLRLVRRGQALEPDNAFFDWMEIRFLLISRRDREALELLTQAAVKPRYDEHLRAEMKAQLANFEGVRPLLPDERIGTLWGVLLPELSVYRHMRGTLQWRIDQLEQSGRHEEAIALGAALRRLCMMQMRAAPFLITSLNAASGLRGVWAGGNRNRPQGVQLALLNGLSGYDAKKDAALAQRYFQYLSQHGHRELLPEARAQLREYQQVQSQSAVHPDDFLNANRNKPLALCNLYWAAGGLALAGAVLAAVLWLLPVGWRASLRNPASVAWLPRRRVFYPQLVAWGGAALCVSYAGYIEFLVEREPLGCVVTVPGVGDPQILLSFAALGLPFAAALLTQLLEVRAQMPKAPTSQRWVPNLLELGVSVGMLPILARTWRVFCLLLIVVGVLGAPFTAYIFWTPPIAWDFLGLYPLWPSLRLLSFVTPCLAGMWLLFVAGRWLMNFQGADRSAIFAAVARFRGYCGAYVTVFSWLILMACLCNVPLERTLDRGFTEYLGLEERLSSVGVAQAPRTSVKLQALPPIPVFPTPTPPPLGSSAAEAPPAA
jgi:hypothetical protein